MQALTRPKFFIPVHGEYKHLKKHADLAVQMGMPQENVIIAEIGNVIESDGVTMKVVSQVPSGRILVDGLGVGDVGSIVLRDRKHLAEDGIIMVVMALNGKTHKMAAEPEVITRGFIYMRENEGIMEELKHIATVALQDTLISKHHDWNTIKNNVKSALGSYIYEGTHRKPIILPVIIDV